MRAATCRLAVVVMIGAACAGCRSPEASRTRGGGPGGDPGNRPATVQMHGGSDPFWRTPDHIGETQPPPLGPARQARNTRS